MGRQGEEQQEKATAGPVQDQLTIRDLEQFSGIKAHTIRVWERRYGLLQPTRTRTNLRRYGLDELRTVLNVAFLSRHGMRISRIAAASPGQRERWVQEWNAPSDTDEVAMDALKMATLAYDTAGFQRTSREFEARQGFEAVVERLYLPYLEQVGLLWQTSAVCPAQEHFAGQLVRQALIGAISNLPPPPSGQADPYVLFLPENEIHELALLYIQYLLQRAGRAVIYLGQSVPREDLFSMARQFARPMTFVGICTCMPQQKDIGAYLNELQAGFDPGMVRVLLGGRLIREWQGSSTGHVGVFRTLQQLREQLGLNAFA